MEHIQYYLDIFRANPEWAITIVFLIAFGEALLIIGLFVPSTVALVGAGVLVGSGQLDFWPVFLATAIGAIAGDQVSYWAGRWWGDSLKQMWPLNRYPQLVARGEDYVRQHGGKSIAIGRFVPGVKAVVPGIVGMFRMNQPFFVAVNVSSGLVWTAAHIFPGILIGQGLSFAGELSGRLAVVLLVLIAILAIGGWLLRIAAAGLAPYFRRVLWRLSGWAKSFRNRPMQRLGRTLSPDHPRASATLLAAIVFVIGLAAILDMSFGLLFRDRLSNVDLSMQNLLSELRTAPGDELMVAIKMLGDRLVIWLLGAAVVVWLLWRRAWRAGIAAAGTLVLAEMLVLAIKLATARFRPSTTLFENRLEIFSFPCEPVVLATVVLGIVATLSSRGLGRWSKALVTTLAGIVVMSIGFANMYLDASWTTDVLGGIALGVVLVAGYSILIEALPAGRVRSLWFTAAMAAVAAIAVTLNFSSFYADQAQRFAAKTRIATFSLDEWTRNEWKLLPGKRIDLVAKAGEPFFVQWIGDIAVLEKSLAASAWQIKPKWAWKDSIEYLDNHASLDKLPPRPLLHQGLVAQLTAVRPVAGQSNVRLVLRAYKTNVQLSSQNQELPVYSLSLTQESLQPTPKFYALPRPAQVRTEELASVARELSDLGTARVLATHAEVSPPLAILMANQ